MSEQIVYEVTLEVTVPSGRGRTAPSPIFEDYYAACPDLIDVKVTRAQRLTPATNYGGPDS